MGASSGLAFSEDWFAWEYEGSNTDAQGDAIVVGLGDKVLDILLAVLQTFQCILVVYSHLTSLVSKATEVVWLKHQRDFPSDMVTTSMTSRMRSLFIQNLAVHVSET